MAAIPKIEFERWKERIGANKKEGKKTKKKEKVRVEKRNKNEWQNDRKKRKKLEKTNEMTQIEWTNPPDIVKKENRRK